MSDIRPLVEAIEAYFDAVDALFESPHDPDRLDAEETSRDAVYHAITPFAPTDDEGRYPWEDGYSSRDDAHPA